MFDSCHSGTAAKGGIGASRKHHRPDDEDPNPTGAVDKNAALDVGGFVLISGCQSKQSSYEYTTTDNRTFGTLTFFLTEVIETFDNNDQAITYDDIFPTVKRLVSSESPQEPGISGIQSNKFVFCDESAFSEPCLIVQPENDFVLVPAGKSLGLTVDSILAVYSPRTRKFGKEFAQPYAKIRITELLKDGNAKAEAIDEVAIEADSRAVVETLSLSANPIRVFFDTQGESFVNESNSSDTSVPDVDTLNSIRDAILRDDILTLSNLSSAMNLTRRSRSG